MEEKKINITFDLETLGNTSNAPIAQIGAVKFSDDGEIIDKFKRNIKLSSLERYGFHVDYETIQWWLEQDDKAIKSVFVNDDAIDLRLALRDFIEWIGKPGEYVYWSHATFDPPILNNNMIKVGIKNPIPFRAHRDIRTLTHFVGLSTTDRQGIHHDALDDCLYQAEYISKGLKVIESWKKSYQIN